MNNVRVSSLSLEVDASNDGFINVRQQVQKLAVVGRMTPIVINEEVLREFHSDDFNISVNGMVVHWKRTNPTGKKFITIVVDL
jgi:hypothetical protein